MLLVSLCALVIATLVACYDPATEAFIQEAIAKQQAAGIPYYPGVHTYGWPSPPGVPNQPGQYPRPVLPTWPQRPVQPRGGMPPPPPPPGMYPGMYPSRPHPGQPQPGPQPRPYPGPMPGGPPGGYPGPMPGGPPGGYPQGPPPGHPGGPGGRGPPEIETEDAETFPAVPDDGRGGGPTSAVPRPGGGYEPLGSGLKFRRI